MRYTNVRTFNKHFFEEVKDLPVTVTKYGVPQFIVESAGGTDSKPAEKISKKFPKEEVLTPEIKTDLKERCGVRGCLGYGDPCEFKGEKTTLCKDHRIQILKGPDSRQLKVL
jgi:hypothetical protein